MRALHTLLPTHGFKQKCDLTSGTLKWSTETHFVLKCSCESWCQKGAAKHLGACLSAVPDRTGLGGQSFLSATNRGFLLGLLLCHNILIITLVSGEFRKLVTSLSISDSASIPADSTKLTVDLKREFWDSCSFFFCFWVGWFFWWDFFFFSYFEIFFFPSIWLTAAGSSVPQALLWRISFTGNLTLAPPLQTEFNFFFSLHARSCVFSEMSTIQRWSRNHIPRNRFVCFHLASYFMV